ncbi:MAG: helix-turn-helix domain-containing protein [Nitrospiraceae bacterium]
MDFQEAFKYLKIKPGTLRDWIRLRRIPFHRAGRRILFRARELDAWLEARKIAHRLSKRELRAAS